MRWRLLWSLVVVTSLVAGSGAAEAGTPNQLLRGDYAFSGEPTCLVSRGGFNLDLTPVGPPAPFPFVFSFSVQGVRTFNGDGTGTLTARVVSMNHPVALPTPTPFFNRGGASSADIASDFTYQVAADRTFTIQTPLVTGTVLTGPSAGRTLAITDLPVFSGRISKDHRTLTLFHGEPGVETVTFSGGSLPPDVQDRICHRSRIFLEQKGDH